MIIVLVLIVNLSFLKERSSIHRDWNQNQIFWTYSEVWRSSSSCICSNLKMY